MGLRQITFKTLFRLLFGGSEGITYRERPKEHERIVMRFTTLSTEYSLWLGRIQYVKLATQYSRHSLSKENVVERITEPLSKRKLLADSSISLQCKNLGKNRGYCTLLPTYAKSGFNRHSSSNPHKTRLTPKEWTPMSLVRNSTGRVLEAAEWERHGHDRNLFQTASHF